MGYDVTPASNLPSRGVILRNSLYEFGFNYIKQVAIKMDGIQGEEPFTD